MAKKDKLKEYIYYYNNERISLKLKEEPGAIPNSIPNKQIQFFVQAFGFTSHILCAFILHKSN